MPRFTTADGTRLHYLDTGEGPPLLCLAGLTRNASDFDYVMPHLAGRRVIRLDYRGRGGSAWADPATYTIPQEAHDAIALMDHLGLASVPILGTSRGGLIGMMLAATAKDRLSGLCLNDIGPEIAETGIEVIRNYVGLNPKERTFEEAAAMRATLLKGFEDVPQGRWDVEVRKHYQETPEGLRINYDPKLREAVLSSADAPPPDLWPLFAALDGLPIAAIRGANSDLLAPETFSEMQARRPDMIAAEVPGRGHVPFLDEPEALAVIRAWLERVG